MTSTDEALSLGSGSCPGFGEDVPLDLPNLTGSTIREMAGLVRGSYFNDWSQAAERVGYCSHPVRVRGRSETVNRQTGEALGSYSTTSEPLGVALIPCGTRRESLCLPCSRVYARDTFELIRAGLVGGKGVPENVADNPLVFATFTAPSFGLVHGTRKGKPCRPRRRDDRTRCPHGRPTWCSHTHDENDQALGAPLCWECYDYLTHTVWQWFAPELWRRFTIALRRRVAVRLGVKDSRLGTVATVQYAKVAEYQALNRPGFGGGS